MLMHYELIRQIGQGGFGQVFLAHDRQLELEVAIKVMRPELAAQPEIIRRFQNGARVAAQLRHPAIQLIYSMGYDERSQTRFVVMEYLPGGDLRERLTQTPLSLTDALQSFATIAEAMAFAHQQGIIHRDLKPANIMYNAAGRLVVTDFDLARISSEVRRTRAGTMMGTLAYASPEQLRGEDVGPGSDIYTLGVILCELLTGRRPFTGNQRELVQAHLNQAPPQLRNLNPDLPEALDTVVQRALAKVPAERFASATALAAAALAAGGATAEVEADNSGTAINPFATQHLVGLAQPCLVLRIIEGSQAGQVVPLGERLSIGSRKAPNDLALDDKFASRAHGRIEHQGAGYQLIDLGSANGTWLNQQRVPAHQPVALKPGDQIRIGYTLLRLEWLA
ncbi:MAG: protein kinase domain-containing protein [Oscillochloridaceae bacterium umkhey_bin13]